ncbi:MAG: hypothetical protein J5817_04365 [Treponema sp.]|nr:hypothetical protein [Treponema sp.]
MKNTARHYHAARNLILALTAIALCTLSLLAPASAHAEKAEKFPYGKKGKTEKSFTSCYYSKKISKLNMTVEVPEFEGCDPLNKSIKKWLSEKCKYAEENYTDLEEEGELTIHIGTVTYTGSYISVLFYEIVNAGGVHPYIERKSFVFNKESKKMVASAKEFISDKAYKAALEPVLEKNETSADEAFCSGIPDLDKVPFVLTPTSVELVIGGEHMYGYMWGMEFIVPVNRK